MIEGDVVREFLAGDRIAVVGASDDQKNFGRTIVREMCDHGYNVVAVNPNAEQVAGCACYPDLEHVPGDVDGVIVMVHGDKAAGVVDACAAKGVRHVWLFKGLGGAGAVSDDALDRCQKNGIEVVAGACPLMFLEPVGWFHRVHRGARRMNRSISC
jgi:predicted CoA-binding protein